MENLSSPEGSKKDKVINLTSFINETLQERFCKSFNRMKSVKEKFADHFMFIKSQLHFSQATFLFTFLDVQVLNKDSNC